MEKNVKMNVGICISGSLCYTAEIKHTVNQLYFNFFLKSHGHGAHSLPYPYELILSSSSIGLRGMGKGLTS